jgi:hypothetical protein
MTAIPFREEEFDAYLKQLFELALEGDDLLSGGGKLVASSGPSDFPFKAVWDLKTPATIHYHAALDLTKQPLLAPAANLMVRALLETHAHLVWIWLGEPASNRTKPGDACLGDNNAGGCTPERRGVCVAFGMTRQFMDNIAKVDPAVVPAGTQKAVSDRLNDLAQLHTKLGCTGHGRGYSDVRPTLEMLKKRGHVPWAHDLWVASSAVAHGLMPDQYWSAATGTLIKGGPAEPQARIDLAMWATRIYFNLVYCCLGVLAPGKQPDLKKAVGKVLAGGDPFDWTDGT